jgi:hypothetical protein
MPITDYGLTGDNTDQLKSEIIVRGKGYLGKLERSTERSLGLCENVSAC